LESGKKKRGGAGALKIRGGGAQFLISGVFYFGREKTFFLLIWGAPGGPWGRGGGPPEKRGRGPALPPRGKKKKEKKKKTKAGHPIFRGGILVGLGGKVFF